MHYIAGILLAIGSLLAAVVHLNQDSSHFWDFVAFVCVTGGTLAVALMTFPWQHKREIFRSFRALFTAQTREDSEALAASIDFYRAMTSGERAWDRPVRTLHDEILRDGAELITLGFPREKVREILEERIHQSVQRTQKVANAFRSLAKYPPAFGLAGTVLGLVTLMRKVSEGADAKQTGLMMAIALMATFYGLLVANLVVNPAGEHLAKNAAESKRAATIALHAVLLLFESASLLEAQETLNSYVAPDRRLNVIAGLREAS